MFQVIEFYLQNLQLARDIGDERGELSALSSLGRAYQALEDYDKAVGCYELALKIARQIGDARNERLALKHLNESRKPSGKEDKNPSKTEATRTREGKSNKKADNSPRKNSSRQQHEKKTQAVNKKQTPASKR